MNLSHTRDRCTLPYVVRRTLSPDCLKFDPSRMMSHERVADNECLQVKYSQIRLEDASHTLLLTLGNV